MTNSWFKFRAWDKNRKKMWSHSDLYKMDCSNEYPFLALIRGFYATNMFPGEEMDVIPMRYTGLEDKNGKEIYEWDIVRFHYKTGVYKIGTVVWNDLFGSWDIDCSDFVSYKSLGQYKSVSEVIGNIFEHKHLLEGTE